MNRRLYLTYPTERDAVRAVADLESAGAERARMHAVAGEGVDVEALPRATPGQCTERAFALERRL